MRKKNTKSFIIMAIITIIAMGLSAVLALVAWPKLFPTLPQYRGLIFFGLLALLSFLGVFLSVKVFKISFR